MSKRRSGFSLIELLVVTAMSLFSVALLVPAVQRAVKAAAHKQAINNLKQILLATHNYHSVFDKLPPATYRTEEFDKAGKLQPTVSIHLLPYVEQLPLYEEIFSEKAVGHFRIGVFNAPEDSSTTDFIRVQNFAANVRIFTDIGVNTAWDKTVLLKGPTPCTATLKKTFTNGTSNTIAFATRYASSRTASKNGESMTPCGYYDLPLANNGGAFIGATPMASSPATADSSSGWQLAPTLAQVNCAFAVSMAHAFEKDGILVGVADGSVRMVGPGISTGTWNNAMSPNSGNPLGKDW